jgi:hypothetical protein
MKVLKEFQVCGSESFHKTFKVGMTIDPEKEGITKKSIGQMVDGGFLEGDAPAPEAKKGVTK